MTRKRIRGLRRHFRAHQQQAVLPARFDPARLTDFRVDYQQLGLAPWYTHQKPPTRFRQLWVSRLVRDFYHWQAQLSECYSDFYLAVWLFEPRFGHSQLVAAIGERRAHYEQLFTHWAGARVHPYRELPPEYQALPGLPDLHWTSYPDVELLLPDDFAEQRAWASKKPHWPGATLGGEPYIAVQVGWVWVGQQKKRVLQ